MSRIEQIRQLLAKSPDDTFLLYSLGMEQLSGDEPREAATTFARARQAPSVVRRSGASGETRLFNADVLEFFDATRLDVADEIDVSDGRLYVGIVTAGAGSLDGDFGRLPVRRGDTFACAATLDHRFRAGAEPLAVVRCMGPQA